MSGTKYLPEIRYKYPDENPFDIVKMIDILAEERGSSIRVSVSDGEYEYSATIWCPIFDPIKPRAYQDEIRDVRLRYRSVAEDTDLQRSLRSSFTDELLRAPDAQHAIIEATQRGIQALFR